jgi:hypothetical protein
VVIGLGARYRSHEFKRFKGYAHSIKMNYSTSLNRGSRISHWLSETSVCVSCKKNIKKSVLLGISCQGNDGLERKNNADNSNTAIGAPDCKQYTKKDLTEFELANQELFPYVMRGVAGSERILSNQSKYFSSYRCNCFLVRQLLNALVA